jgi:threonine dehydratase
MASRSFQRALPRVRAISSTGSPAMNSSQSGLGKTVTLADVIAARDRITEYTVRTPLLVNEAAGDRAGLPVFLKLECLQHTGAFKARGAVSKISTLTSDERQAGLICASTGNHGLGVAYAAKRFGCRCIVVLPENANPHKTGLLQRLGAEIIVHGIGSDVRQEKVSQLSSAHGYAQIPPFSDPAVIAGQGTVGLEILEDLSDVSEVYVPIGGGGLVAGIAVAIKEKSPKTRIFGVEPENSGAMREAVRHNGPVPLANVETVADGLAATITEELNYSIVKRYVDDLILVSDRGIIESTLFLIENAKVLVEPSGGASFAGLLANPRRQGRAVCVVSGGNVTLRQLHDHQRRFQL